MLRDSQFLKIFVSTPKYMLFKKVISKSYKYFQRCIGRRRDLIHDTRVSFNIPHLTEHFLPVNKLDLSNFDKTASEYLSSMYCEHRFDLLGSGWIKNSYYAGAAGLEGYRYEMNVPVKEFDLSGDWLNCILPQSHVNSSKKIWSLIDKTYEPIDWQKDYKSGFRWIVKNWYKDISFGDVIGVDIKVPWELARFQHLPQLALFSLILPERRDKQIKEFRNQVLDFIATNPPRMGVNWACTMDVGIRAANMLVSYDIFSQIDDMGIIDEPFKQIFSNSIYEHGQFIINNLERMEHLTTNHYLANIAGLLFIAAYLDENSITNEWLAFAQIELFKEFEKQFYPDGGNFESSTSYHRLSSEIMICSTALLIGLESRMPDGKIHIPSWVPERLWRAASLTDHLTKPNGRIAQIGDNDSGRFFRFSPNGTMLTSEEARSRYLNLSQYDDLELFWDEEILDHKTLISAISGLFEGRKWQDVFHRFPLERSVVQAFTGGRVLGTDLIEIPNSIKPNLPFDAAQFPYVSEKVFRPSDDSSKPLTKDLQFFQYQDSGFYIFLSERLHLILAATPVGQNGNGGHSHGDKLAVELTLDGIEVLADPGTYIYTPLPEWRNRFRSVRVHHTISVDEREQNNWATGLRGMFSSENSSRCNILSIDNFGICACATYYDIVHIRKIIIQPNEVIIRDYCNKPFSVNFQPGEWFSNGYGKLMRREPA